MGILSALCKSRRPGGRSTEHKWNHLEGKETEEKSSHEFRSEQRSCIRVKGITTATFDVRPSYYNSNIVFRPGESMDMDLLNKNRLLVYTGKLMRRSETRFMRNGWTELFVLLFDNYLVLTREMEMDGATKYVVDHRPISLDLLSLSGFLDPPTQRNAGILRLGLGKRRDDGGAHTAPYPCTIQCSGRLGGQYALFAESAQAQAEWKQKLEEAISLRKIARESNRVFGMKPLSTGTFFTLAVSASTAAPSWSREKSFDRKVTCSVPFTTTDGRTFVAIGCAEGVWIGPRHDSRSMQHVLHLGMVTQCAVLEEFGMFLVLADRVLFAYHIDALVQESSPQNAHTFQTPQRLSSTQDVHFFSVGKQDGRTLVFYMSRKGLDSIFHVIEPVVERIDKRSFTRRCGTRPVRSVWFRLYKEFFLPSKSFNLVVLKTRIAVLCPKGFEIMDLANLTSLTVPVWDGSHKRLAKRCESRKPIGMFRVEDEFLLCYDEFGIYVNKHGSPSRSSSTVEWEGTAEHVGMHWPYILLFDTRFVEVRHAATGLLAQIIPGDDIRCIWDGRGTSITVAAKGAEVLSRPANHDSPIHIVMSVPELQGQIGQPSRQRTIAQHVFELVPTAPPDPFASARSNTLARSSGMKGSIGSSTNLDM